MDQPTGTELSDWHVPVEHSLGVVAGLQACARLEAVSDTHWSVVKQTELGPPGVD